MGFQDNLRKQREQARYTAKEFATLLGLPYTTYVGYENQGHEPKYETLCRIAAALHVTTDELLGYRFKGKKNYFERYIVLKDGLEKLLNKEGSF